MFQKSQAAFQNLPWLPATGRAVVAELPPVLGILGATVVLLMLLGLVAS